MTLTGHLRGVAATRALGRYLGERARPGDVVLLEGELGAGKTVLAKGVAEGLGLDEAVVTSPTFTIINEYPARLTMYHVDLYRLNEDSDFEAEGVLDVLGADGLAVVEWAERLGDARPAGALTIRLELVDGDVRRASLIDEGGRWLDRPGLTRLLSVEDSAGVD
ncbi:MAG: tRNA (adenosine(37)-N6)-threonylcarbamoyltransferase complex ATPase subunit type 1 TsaE [Proteobacteria bacterium]|nr:tRNA (adenosine(37)-N6)-threonylcarbamoyltransferase complex ATPase subunit type 1 TsaE [Pseudomonadota bacterium]